MLWWFRRPLLSRAASSSCRSDFARWFLRDGARLRSATWAGRLIRARRLALAPATSQAQRDRAAAKAEVICVARARARADFLAEVIGSREDAWRSRIASLHNEE